MDGVARHLATARAARRPLHVPLHRRHARHVHVSHARQRSAARLGTLRRDRRAAAHPRPEEANTAHDFVEMLTGWSIQSTAENHWTINGKEYPATQPMNVKKGERFRIRWISLTGEDTHTMHTHGHYQRSSRAMHSRSTTHDVQDTVALAPGQRVDVVVTADQQPGHVARALPRDGSHRRRRRHARGLDHGDPICRRAEQSSDGDGRRDVGRHADAVASPSRSTS